MLNIVIFNIIYKLQVNIYKLIVFNKKIIKQHVIKIKKFNKLILKIFNNNKQFNNNYNNIKLIILLMKVNKF